MCFGGGAKVDDTIQRQQQEEAREARAREEARQARIREGTTRIDQIFSGFDDGFHQEREDAYMDFYQPQLDDQFGKAQDQLTFALARAGTLKSTLAADKQADLQSQYGVQRASLLSQAKDAVNQQRARVNQEKSSLVAQLNATGDADRASNEALARTQQMFQQQPTYNPLPDLFAGAASGIGNWADGRSNDRMFTSYFGHHPRGGNTKIIGG